MIELPQTQKAIVRHCIAAWAKPQLGPFISHQIHAAPAAKFRRQPAATDHCSAWHGLAVQVRGKNPLGFHGCGNRARKQVILASSVVAQPELFFFCVAQRLPVALLQTP